MKPTSTKRDMSHALQVVEASAEMAALRRVLAHERPIVRQLVELFGAAMFRKGVIETLERAPKPPDQDSRRVALAGKRR